MRFRASLLLMAWLVPAGAFAAEVSEELDAVGDVVDVLMRRSKSLEDQLAPGSGYVTEDTALRRYEEHVYQHLVGEHDEAALGFFALVTTGALGDSGLHRDAEWYLADSLRQLGNLATAAARFQAIVDQPGHPFRDDAVRQILEIYALTGDTEAFSALYEREILRGGVLATDAVRYSLGKSFHLRGEFDRARTEFGSIPPESPLHARARYFLGTLLVQEGDPRASLDHFRAAAEAEVVTADDQKVHDLALLAGGRVLFELGEFSNAAATYDLISGESEYNADKLYEMVWAYIQQEKWSEAQRVVEIFLIAYPEHAYTAQLKLLQGHLHVSRQEFDPALAAYENVLGEYGPIRDYFGSLEHAEDPSGYLRQLTGEAGYATLRLPDFAVAKMLEDPDLARAVAILSEIAAQEADIATSEAIIRELGPLLAEGQGLGGFEEMRYDAVLAANQAAEQSLVLLEVEEVWLRDELPPNQKSRLDPLVDRRLALIGQARDSAWRLEEAREALERHNEAVRRVRGDTNAVLAVAAEHLAGILEIRAMLADPRARLQGPMRTVVEEDLAYLERELVAATDELQALDRELSGLQPPRDARRLVRSGGATGSLLDQIEALRHDYAALRPGNRLADTSERVDGLHHGLNAIHARLKTVVAGLNDVEASEMDVLRARFEHEVAEVASQRAAVDQSHDATHAVSLGLTREGFGRLASFFTDSLLKADMGIVDVYWAQKLATVDEIGRVKAEKQELIDELDRRFDLIEQKLGR